MSAKKLNLVDANVQAAKRLADIRDQIKMLEAEEKTLKQVFMNSGFSSFDAGDVLVTVSETSRESLDKGSLINELGEEFVKNFTKITSYLRVSVKRK